MTPKLNPIGYAGFAFVVILSFFFIYYTFGLNFILGRSSYWDTESGDTIQHLSGINLYLSSAWQFPLLAFDSLNYPIGTRVTFVDGIPLLAFFLKVLLPKNHGFINPLGYWVALNFVFQAIAAWWITKELKVQSWFFLIFLLVVCLTFPIFIDRLRNIALMSHWLILFAIALYLRGTRLDNFPIIAWGVLLFSSFYIHIYLFSMVLGIYFAAIFDEKQSFTLKHIVTLFLPILILCGSLFIFLLPLPSGLMEERGFSAFAIDLLAPFKGGLLDQLTLPSHFKATGFCYLGLGVILIFMWLLITQLKTILNVIKKRPAFFILMIVFFMYSLSNKIYFDGHLIVSIKYPDFLNFIITQFRASGRFFWPVAYVIVIFSSYVLYQEQKNKPIFSVIMMSCLLIQCIDIKKYYLPLLNSNNHVHKIVVNDVIFNRFINSHVHYIYLYPKASCGVDPQYGFTTEVPLMKYAAKHQLKLNTGFIARYQSGCTDAQQEIARSIKNESVYIFSKKLYKSREEIDNVIGNKNEVFCEVFELGYICKFKNYEVKNEAAI